MHKYSNQKIVILGGYGTFGSLISEQLVNSANVIIAGHDEKGDKNMQTLLEQTTFCAMQKTKNPCRKLFQEHLLLSMLRALFLPRDYSIPHTCIEENSHYIDLADDREYVREFIQLDELAKEREIFSCTGASTTPAVTHALVSQLSSGISRHPIRSGFI